MDHIGNNTLKIEKITYDDVFMYTRIDWKLHGRSKDDGVNLWFHKWNEIIGLNIQATKDRGRVIGSVSFLI